MKKYFVLLCSMLFLVTGCGESEEKIEPVHVEENPIVTMTFKDYGDVKIELYPNEVYNTVANFVNLVQDGFYDDNIINRVQQGFVIQGGGGSDPGYTIEGEFKSNNIENNISHEKGVISMARSTQPNSASGQFFIMLADNTSLDGDYAAFGKVIEGEDVIDEIGKAKLKYDSNESLAGMGFLAKSDYITIEKATVDTKGHTYKVNKIK